MFKNKREKQIFLVFLIYVVVVSITLIYISVKIDNVSRKLDKTIKKLNNNKKDFSTEKNKPIKINLEYSIYSYIKNRYTKIPKEIAQSIAKNIIIYSDKYKIQPELLVGMIEIESMFNPMAISRVGARGLMQVMPEWVPKLNINKLNDLHDIDVGIEAGIEVFKIHLNEAKNDVSKGLFLYVGKDSEYVRNVYSAIGRFTTYKTKVGQTND